MIKLDNSMVRFMAWLASKRFGSNDGVFNSCQFSGVIEDLIGLPILDGHIVRLILSGRPGIRQLSGGCHWRVV